MIEHLHNSNWLKSKFIVAQTDKEVLLQPWRWLKLSDDNKFFSFKALTISVDKQKVGNFSPTNCQKRIGEEKVWQIRQTRLRAMARRTIGGGEGGSKIWKNKDSRPRGKENFLNPNLQRCSSNQVFRHFFLCFLYVIVCEYVPLVFNFKKNC